MISGCSSLWLTIWNTQLFVTSGELSFPLVPLQLSLQRSLLSPWRLKKLAFPFPQILGLVGKLTWLSGIRWFSEHAAYLAGCVECCRPFKDAAFEMLAWKSSLLFLESWLVSLSSVRGLRKRHSKSVVLNQQSDAFKMDLPLWESLISTFMYSSWVSVFTTNLYHGDPIKLLIIKLGWSSDTPLSIYMLVRHPLNGAPGTILVEMRTFWRHICHSLQLLDYWNSGPKKLDFLQNFHAQRRRELCHRCWPGKGFHTALTTCQTSL